jgi:hypothetical protein
MVRFLHGATRMRLNLYLNINTLLLQIWCKASIRKGICTITGRLERPSGKRQGTLSNCEKREHFYIVQEFYALVVLWGCFKTECRVCYREGGFFITGFAVIKIHPIIMRGNTHQGKHICNSSLDVSG